MRWDALLTEVHTLAVSSARNPEVSDVVYDSRLAVPGVVFAAMRGGTVDGNQYIPQAIENGAAAVLTDTRESFSWCEASCIPAALVAHGRRALAECTAALLGHPEHQLTFTAVTGTNGKTTTSSLTDALLRAAGRTTVLIGTIETRVAGEARPSAHTTPESRDLLHTFAEGTVRGATEAVMEMSSHALDQERVYGLPVDVGIFTNLTQDHLDYHHTMKAYAAAKARLFRGIGAPAPRVAILNADDPWFQVMRDAARECAVVWRYSLQNASAELFAHDLNTDAGGTRFRVATPMGPAAIESRLLGRVNVYNMLAALGAALARGVPLTTAVRSIAMLEPVAGRFQSVPNSLGITVVVDYAHTDDALRNLLTVARELAGHHGRVLTLFGCGGDRDRSKRPKMGCAAGTGSDLVVITSDNPRSEDPAAIAAEALAGTRETDCPSIRTELDRAAAISMIIEESRPGDVVLIAGKGHEKTQTANGVSVPFDDVEVAAQTLRARERKATSS